MSAVVHGKQTGRPVRVGVIGLGFMGATHVASFQAAAAAGLPEGSKGSGGVKGVTSESCARPAAPPRPGKNRGAGKEKHHPPSNQ